MPSERLTRCRNPCVDTGCTGARAAVRSVISNYGTDLFCAASGSRAELIGVNEKNELGSGITGGRRRRLRVIADHARATTFLDHWMAILPSMSAVGYVLRKIMRLAIRHGRLRSEQAIFF